MLILSVVKLNNFTNFKKVHDLVKYERVAVWSLDEFCHKALVINNINKEACFFDVHPDLHRITITPKTLYKLFKLLNTSDKSENWS